jgi:hypothetical protein
MNLYLTRARVGMGKPIGFGDAVSDLAAFDSTVLAGDAYMGGNEFQNAVTAYQAAGNSGAVTIGPEIDGQTNNTSQSRTHQAWLYNQGLSALDAASATVIEAAQAQNLAHSMQALYHEAITLTPAPLNLPPPQAPVALTDAASALIAYLRANGCTTNSFQACTDFQAAWNAAGGGTLVVDGKYGPATEAALQGVLNQTQNPPEAAPASCFSNTNGITPGGSTTTTTAITLPAKPLNWGTIALIAAAVVGAGAVAYTVHKRSSKKGRRRNPLPPLRAYRRYVVFYDYNGSGHDMVVHAANREAAVKKARAKAPMGTNFAAHWQDS